MDTKDILLNAIYNLEKNVKGETNPKLKEIMTDMVLSQLKATLERMTSEWELELTSLGLNKE